MGQTHCEYAYTLNQFSRLSTTTTKTPESRSVHFGQAVNWEILHGKRYTRRGGSTPSTHYYSHDHQQFCCICGIVI